MFPECKLRHKSRLHAYPGALRRRCESCFHALYSALYVTQEAVLGSSRRRHASRRFQNFSPTGNKRRGLFGSARWTMSWCGQEATDELLREFLRTRASARSVESDLTACFDAGEKIIWAENQNAIKLRVSCSCTSLRLARFANNKGRYYCFSLVFFADYLRS